MAKGKLPRTRDDRGPYKGKQKAAEPRYDTLDDALEAGVEAEEKGERFSVGPKAQRFYEQALQLYQRGSALDPRSADAAYNAARVLYLLSTEFYLPPNSPGALSQSVSLYKRALSLAPPIPSPEDETLAAPFTLDVLFNLGVAVQTLAELVDDVGWGSAATSAAGSGAQMQPSTLLQEALSTFEVVAQGQARVLAAQARDVAAETGSAELEAGQVQTPAERGQEDMDTEGSDAGDTSTYTSSLVTPAALLDTLLSMHTCALSLIPMSNSTDEINVAASISSDALRRATEVVNMTPDGEKQSAEGEWVEKLAELELAGVNAQVAEAGKRAEIAESGAEMSSWPAVESEQAALARLEEEVLARGLALIDNSTQAQAQAQAQRGTAEVRFRVQALCDIGDACLALARIRARQASNAEAHGVLSIGDDMNGKGTHQAGLERAWELAARAAKMFTLALSALDTSSGSGTGAYAVLGASNTSTPTSRTRSAISYSLSSLSLLRTHPLLLRTIPASSNAHSQLLDNARVYARRAISECGLAWTLNARIGPEGRPPIQAASQDHAHGGWDSLRGEADALFGYVRALYGRWRAFSSSQPDSTSKSTNLDSTRTEMDAITCAIWALAHRSNDGGAWNLAVGSGGESATKQGVSRFLDELLSEEGQVSMDAGARAFWSGLDGRVREDRWASVWERLEGLEVGA